MNQQEFHKLYNTAIQKVAVGFYILDNCGSKLNFDAETIQNNKQSLCAILSDGIHVSITTIFADACSVYAQLPTSYIRELRSSGLLEKLVADMGLLNGQKKLG